MVSKEVGNFHRPLNEGSKQSRPGWPKLLPWRVLFRRKPPGQPVLSVSNTADDVLRAIPESPLEDEATPEDRSIIKDVLPHDLRGGMNPIAYEDIGVVMDWAKDPSVAGHIYQLESGPEELYKNRWGAYLEYYRGVRDDEGRPTEPRNSTFFKAVNSAGEMLAVTTVRWKDVEFVKRGRTAYLERLIVDPELHGKKIGLGFGIEVLDNIFYKSEMYDGLPASELRASAFADRDAGRHDINDNFLTLLGFEKHGDPMLVNGRRIQPYRASLADYEKARPKALEHMATLQPERLRYLVKQGKILQAKLRAST